MSQVSEGWRDYLVEFHAQRSGITEDLLALATDDTGRTPYDWLAAAVPRGVRVLDLACGSAPTGELLGATTYVGLDLSHGELRLASARVLPVAQADATRLPIADRSVDAVVCSMAVQLLPLRDALAEVRRVLRPGGTFVATVPTNRPLPARDRLRWGSVLVALHQAALRYPNDAALRSPADAFAAAGLTLVADDARAFGVDVPSAAVADLLLDGLYLPDASARRVRAARSVVHGWVGGRTTVPVRRLVARG